MYKLSNFIWEKVMNLKLFVAFLGARIVTRMFKQHQYFFCICSSFDELKIEAEKYWLESGMSCLHIDTYMCLEQICGHKVIIRDEQTSSRKAIDEPEKQLFLINLGGYLAGVLEEQHKKLWIVAINEEEAKVLARRDSFFNEMLQDEHCRPRIDDVIYVNTAVKVMNYNSSNISFEEIQDLSKIQEPEVIITGY